MCVNYWSLKTCHALNIGCIVALETVFCFFLCHADENDMTNLTDKHLSQARRNTGELFASEKLILLMQMYSFAYIIGLQPDAKQRTEVK